MAAANSIDIWEFIALHGHADPLKEQPLVLARPGVEGVAIWKSGSRGKPFTVRSVVDYKTIDEARSVFAQYALMIGGDPVSMTWADIPCDGEGFQVVVLDVRAVTIKSIIFGVGGLNPPSGAWLECDWDLIAVEIPD